MHWLVESTIALIADIARKAGSVTAYNEKNFNRGCLPRIGAEAEFYHFEWFAPCGPPYKSQSAARRLPPVRRLGVNGAFGSAPMVLAMFPITVPVLTLASGNASETIFT